MNVMSEAQWRAFLLSDSRTAKLATVRANGAPHCVPIWYCFDGDELVFSSGRSTVKVRNIERDPRVVLSVDNEQFPYGFVSLDGLARVEQLPLDRLREYTTRIAERYVPKGRADAYGDRNAATSEVLVRVQISKVIAWDQMSA